MPRKRDTEPVPMLWEPWTRYEHVETVILEENGTRTQWLVSWGAREEVDLLSPVLDLGNRPQPLYLRFINTVRGESPQALAEQAVAFARKYGLLGLYRRDYPFSRVFSDVVGSDDGDLVPVGSTPYARAARAVMKMAGPWGAVVPEQLEPVDRYLGAVLEVEAYVSVEAVVAFGVEGRGELVAIAGGGSPSGDGAGLMLRYRSLLDGMILRAVYDGLTGGAPARVCGNDRCRKWYLATHPKDIYCSQTCADQVRDRRRAARRKAERRARQAAGRDG